VSAEQLCWDCTLRVKVGALLPEADHGPCEALRHAILTTANSRTTALWLGHERVAAVLGHVGRAGPAITHEDLDALGSGPGVEHLRDLLIAAGALDGGGRALARLEAHAATSVAGLQDADRRIVAAWFRWRVLPRLRRREEAGKSLANSVGNARAALHQVVCFVDELQDQGRALRTCTQADLDSWLARPGAARRTLAAFAAWAVKKKHMPVLSLPPSRASAPAVYANSEDRWAIARRLVRDDELDVADRVAGALVVLYPPAPSHRHRASKDAQCCTRPAVLRGGTGRVSRRRRHQPGHRSQVGQPSRRQLGQLRRRPLTATATRTRK